MAGPLIAGNWAVVLGAYRIPEDGCTVAVHIECEHDRWLKGDLHAHTDHSDGSYTLAEAIADMERLQCDFLATTDHNTATQNAAHPRDAGIVLIPGYELTTNWGHSNFLGAPDPVRDFRATDGERIRALFAEARGHGAYIVKNHPFHPTCAWEWGDAFDYDWIEIWNGPWREMNRKALEWWQQQLASGRRLVAVGGSDTHWPNAAARHAHPTTWVCAGSRTAEGILGGIARGCVFITDSPEGPTMEMTACGAFRMGEEADVSGSSVRPAIALELNRIRAGDQLRIISDRGEEQRIAIADSDAFHYQWDVLDRLFYRAEVWRTRTGADNANGTDNANDTDGAEPVAIGNPIYFKSKRANRP